MKRELVLVNINTLDQEIHREFYPRISHKRRIHLLHCIRRNSVYFEDETSEDLMWMDKETFGNLTDELKYIAYTNMIEMTVGILNELEELQESIIEERNELTKKDN